MPQSHRPARRQLHEELKSERASGRLTDSTIGKATPSNTPPTRRAGNSQSFRHGTRNEISGDADAREDACIGQERMFQHQEQEKRGELALDPEAATDAR